jgi:hypothetical protein
MMANPKRNSDFDADALAHTADEHTKSISALHDRVGTNENFGKTFAEASEDSKPLEAAVRSVFVGLLKNDVETQGAVESVIKRVDGRQLKTQLTVLAKVTLWVCSVIIAAIVGAIINARIN